MGKYVPLTPATPLIHRCGGPPSPEGKVKKLPLRGSWLGAAETEEGRNERERQEKRSMPTALAHKAPHPPPPVAAVPLPRGGRVGRFVPRDFPICREYSF